MADAEHAVLPPRLAGVQPDFKQTFQLGLPNFLLLQRPLQRVLQRPSLGEKQHPL